MVTVCRAGLIKRYQRNALIRRQGQTKVEDAWMYAIASVVTSPNHLRESLSPIALTSFAPLTHQVKGSLLISSDCYITSWLNRSISLLSLLNGEPYRLFSVIRQR